MEKVGITVRKIRLIKGMAQKQVYAGIISRSFANRFESGENDIQSEKLFKILNNLAISPSEFQYINNSYKLPLIDQLLTKINYLYETHAFSALAHWLQQHQDSNNPQIQIVAGYAELLLITFSHHNFPLSRNIKIMLYHLLDKKNWTLQEIKLVSTIIPSIATHQEFKISIPRITEQMEQNCAKYLTKYADYFEVNNELINYYGVVLQTYLNDSAYSAAYKFKEKFIKLDDQLLDWNASIAKQLWLAIWELYFGDFKLGKQKVTDILTFKKLFNSKIDLNIESIISVRLKTAKTYRKSLLK
ncbi:MAG: helix-turn-helix transcriptional regulator [Liquorilactobacillus ghanensis]|uniref:helix-turn-helix domain-containing protein n=1 Tax=Liquorilactobacillus ghanensis TaxID=399370 RepID=UPI0039EBD4F8